MTGSFTVGAVVVNCGPLQNLKICLDAIKGQETTFLRVVIIDNSADKKKQILPCTLAENWDFFSLGYNAGFAAANNIAVEKLADCQWVALVNPDAYLQPDWLTKMVYAARRHPEFSFFASKLLMASDPERLDGRGDAYNMSGLVWRSGHGGQVSEFGDQEVFSPCAAAALYRRDAFLAAGGFDPDFFCFVEDVDLGFRLRLLGHRCMMVAGAIAHHEGSASTGGRHSAFSVYHGHRNMVWAYVKNMPGVLFWLFLPFHIFLNVFTIFWFTIRGQGKIIVRSKVDALRGLSKVWRKRKQIQSRRRLSTRDLIKVLDTRLVPYRRNV